MLSKDTIGVTYESFPLFRCPKCHSVGYIDEDQFNGKVSILHEEKDSTCNYHETINWAELDKDNKKTISK